MCSAAVGMKGCELMWEAGRGVDCRKGQKMVSTGEGGKKGGALLRGAGRGVDC